MITSVLKLSLIAFFIALIYTKKIPCYQIRCSLLPTPYSLLPTPYSLFPIPSI
ncbi:MULTISPECIES: hypothetical protein [Moorena]|uniref:hypothetical protein n=1 Tax=Moorena TaxID=1155738 RepID=UPI001301041E|nr:MULTISPECIES: hypothetical protein [Moorena]NEO16236.1 hypothetical protein [Moorena sp. SIO3E8]NEQ02108.1 hypothetical protein [Moorena sp. SIO3F7]